MVTFVKAHANGNDFMILDHWNHVNALPNSATIMQWANRYRGIGFDQLLCVSQSNLKTQVNCRIFNADGKEVEQCAHGIACVAQFVYARDYLKHPTFVIRTLAGICPVQLINPREVLVTLGRPNFDPQQIPFTTIQRTTLFCNVYLDTSDRLCQKYCESIYSQQVEMLGLYRQNSMWTQAVLDNNSIQEMDLGNTTIRLFVSPLSLGNPHCVVIVPSLYDIPENLGRLLSQHPQFPKQTNVEFMQVITRQQVHLRVYERGVGENQACGSGACAAVVVGRLLGYLDESVAAQFPNGDSVQVTWQDQDASVQMQTTTQMIFEGKLF